MAFDRARFFAGKNRTNMVLIFPAGVCSPVVLGRMLGIMLVFAGTNLRAARADDSLNLVGSNALYTVNGQQSFLSSAGKCSTGQVSPLCVDGGATLKIVGSGNTLLSQGQVFIGYTQSGVSNLVIGDGGQLRLYSSVTQIGWSGGDGQMTVSGAGSQMTTTADSLLVVGTGDNTNGYSSVYNTEHITYGTMTISDGGHVLVGTVATGLYSHGVGTITVDGTNSLLYVAHDYYVNGGSAQNGGNGSTLVSNGAQLIVNGQIYFGSDGTDGDGRLAIQSGGILELGDTTANGQTVSALVDQEGTGGHSEFVLSGGIIRLINSGLSTAMSIQLDGGVQSTVDTNGKAALLSGVLSGNGGLTKAGEGTLTLSGSNTYTGATDIQAGTLKLSGAGTISQTVSMQDSGVLDIADVSGSSVALNSLNGGGSIVLGNKTLNLLDNSSSSANTYSGVIAGSGGLTLSGGATFLTGQNTYTGGTDVQAGLLEVDGSVAGPVSVRSGAVLAGQGSVGQTTVYSGASLLPGSTATGGMLSVTGNLNMEAGSTLLANSVSSTQELVHVTGTASLSGGTVQILGSQRLQYGEQYKVLTAANGVTGRYDTVKYDQYGEYPFLSPTLLYTSDSVNLQLLRNSVPFSAFAQTRNQQAAGNGLQSVGVANPVVQAVVQLSGAGEIHGALDALSGEIHASARTVLIQDSLYVRQAVVDRLAGALCDGGFAGTGQRVVQVRHGHVVDEGECVPERAALWGEAYGGFGSNGGDGNAAGLHHSTAGFVMGVDTPLGADGRWRMGGVLSYGRSMMEGDTHSSSGQSNNVTLGGYGGTHWGRWNLRLGASYTWNMLSLNRTVAFPGFGNTLSSHYNGGTAQGFGELGYRLRMRGAMLEPFGNVAYVSQRTGHFTEHGGAAALVGEATQTGVTFATFGLRASSTFHAYGALLTPHATLGYRHAFGLTTATTHERFAAGSQTYDMDVAGIALSRDTAVVDAGVAVKLTDRIDVGLSYMGQYGGLFTSSGAHGRVTFRF